MPTVRELITRFGFEADTKDLDKLDKSIDMIKEGVTGLSVMVVGAAVSIFALVRASANAADQISDTAAAIGVSADSLQRLGYAAQLSGSNITDMATGLRFLTKNLYEAGKDAGGQMAQEFRKLGISVRDSNGNLRNSSDVLLDISDRIKGIKNPAEQTGVAMTFLGKGGGALVQTLARGREEIEAFGSELEGMGGILSTKQLDDLGAFNDSIDRIWALIRGIGSAIAANLAPSLTTVVNEFREFLKSNQDLIKTNLTGFIKGLSSFLLAAWRVIKIFGQSIAWLIGLFGGMEIVTKAALAALSLLFASTTIMGLKMLISIVRLLGTEFMLTWIKALWPIALIIAGVAAVILIVEDLIAFFNGEDSVVGLLVDGIAKYFTIAMDKVAEFMKGVGDIMKAWAISLGQSLMGMFQPFVNFMKSLGNGMKAIAKGDFAGLSSAISGVFSSGSPSNVSPSNSPAGNVSNRNQQFNVTAPIQVTVPAGTDPGMVGEKAESGISLGLEGVLRGAQRSGSTGVAY